MILPPGTTGVAFTEAGDGDMRNDPSARALVCHRLGITPSWATVQQVHGPGVARVSRPEETAETDALWTTEKGLPLAIFTADCLGVVAQANDAVGVAHAGWRGAAAGIVQHLIAAMENGGHDVERIVIGPGISDCCFEVGPEVSGLFPTGVARTTWGTVSVDLDAVVRAQAGSRHVLSVGGCARHDDRFFSHRRDATKERMATLAWL